MPNRQPVVSRVGQLQVFSLRRVNGHGYVSRDYVTVPCIEPEWKVIESVLDIALGLHESRDGRAALTRLGADAIQQLRPPASQYAFGSREAAEMRTHVDGFLSTIRNDFPRVYIGGDGLGDAVTTRKTWGTDLDRYDPKEAADIYVSDAIVEGLIRSQLSQVRGGSQSQDNGAVNNFKFHLAIALAHEIVHLFIGYLTGDETTMTPPRLTAGGYGSTRVGESGRFWESILLGGFVEIWFPRGSEGALHPGTAYLLMPNNRGPRVSRRISRNYIQDIVNRNFYFPIQCTSSEGNIPNSELTRLYRSTRYQTAETVSATAGVITREQRDNFRFRGLPQNDCYQGSSSYYVPRQGRY